MQEAGRTGGTAMSFISPQNALVVSAYVACASLILTVLTFVLAIFIFREAKKIREIEWINGTNSAWNDFNKLILADNNREEWLEFLVGDTAKFEKYDRNKRINWLLYCYCNILVSSMYADRNKHKTKFFGDIMTSEFKLLKKRREYILEFLKEEGYDREFIALVRRSTEGTT